MATPFPAAGPRLFALDGPKTSPMGELVRALAASLVFSTEAHPPDQAWRTRMTAVLGPLRAAFRDHRIATEGDSGLYADVVLDAPRLARTVDGLVAEHGELDTAMASLARAAERSDTDQAALRERVIMVLDDLNRHGQHDADLVHEAYTTDIGGE